MTAIEVFAAITEPPKWYAGFTSAQNAYNIKKRFKAKKLSFDVLKNMFEHYGYELQAEWRKVK